MLRKRQECGAGAWRGCQANVAAMSGAHRSHRNAVLLANNGLTAAYDIRNLQTLLQEFALLTGAWTRS